MENQLELFPVNRKKIPWVEQLKLFPDYEKKFRLKRFREQYKTILTARQDEKDQELLVVIDKFIEDIKKITKE
jgi:hypothetical protein